MFSHRDEGTPEEAWVLDGRPGTAPVLAIPGPGGHVVVVAAHPDDETLGAGGLMAAAVRHGARVELVVASDGEASHPDSPTHASAELAAWRRREVTAAAACVGVSDVTFLGLADGGLRRRRAELEAAIAARLLPGTLLVTPWRGDRHPDHEACALAARAVLRRRGVGEHWQYPVWAWHWAAPDHDDMPWGCLGRLELDELSQQAKRAGLECHRSQSEPLSDQPGDEPILARSFLAHFRRPYEAFVVEPAHAAGDSAYFERLYRCSPDPWGLAERFYERRKRDVVMSSLPRAHFGRVFEPGCATGLLTERLAAVSDEVVAWDAVPSAVAQARLRVAARPNVTVARGEIPDEWPEGTFDLIVLSEVGYYCDDLDALASAVHASLSPEGIAVGCHWRHPATEHPRHAAEVHDAVGAGLHRVVGHVEEDFLLDVFSVTGLSVAQSEEIVT